LPAAGEALKNITRCTIILSPNQDKEEDARWPKSK
jgi:hypothetical protein